MAEFGKTEFGQVFSVGEIVDSGAGRNRKNAANLEVHRLGEEHFYYQSVRSSTECRMRYSYLKRLIDFYEQLDKKAIQKSVREALRSSGFLMHYSIEHHAYSFAKAYVERTAMFLSQGEELGAPEASSNSGESFTEGRRFTVSIERVERDPRARQACIDHFGAFCHACRFDFGRVYGELGKDFIHVHHHRERLADTQGEQNIDPIEDLIPLCPNCHAMTHREKEMLSVAALREILADCRPPSPC